MSTEKEVTAFLKDFKTKMEIWDILFRDERGKNAQALAALEIRPIERKTILENLTAKDYSQGPIEEKLYGGSDMWVFGKDVKGQEVYIKISLGHSNSHTICISFHIAEYKIKYPLKGEKQ